MRHLMNGMSLRFDVINELEFYMTFALGRLSLAQDSMTFLQEIVLIETAIMLQRP